MVSILTRKGVLIFFLDFVGPSALPSSNKEKSGALRKRKAFPTDPSAYIPGAGMDAAKGAKSSDTNPLIPPKLHSLFKKKKVEASSCPFSG